ncbi:unnamed protein product [Gulo gulo]|uniref:Uncharacterized protein n=1 Tax=Gulo gulo TaxID=48420 RepID=A0A9X9Q3H1_GULGU|nr:unnamed protein product [Gulo gulo]
MLVIILYMLKLQIKMDLSRITQKCMVNPVFEPSSETYINLISGRPTIARLVPPTQEGNR